MRHSLSAGAIDQILRELSTLGLGDGLLVANQRLYTKLVHGITVTEFMPDGKKHQPTIAVIDWADPGVNRFDVTEQLRVFSRDGVHERAPDIVGYVNRHSARRDRVPAMCSKVKASTGTCAYQRDDEAPHLLLPTRNC